jgi:hypothetical protein
MAKRLTATEIIDTLLAFAGSQSVAPQDVAAGVDGAAVELDGEPAIVLFNLATASATTEFTLDVEESANGTTGWESADAADLLGGALPAITTANDNGVVARYYVGGANHIRATFADDAAGTPALLASAAVIKTRTLAHLKPYEIDQVMDQLSRRSFDRGTGDVPVQARLNAIIA